jgi:hypothetical protein
VIRHIGQIDCGQIDHLEAAHRGLSARGADVVSAPHIIHRTREMELWMAFFRDGERKMFAVMSEVFLGAPRS